jgi:hypothetical protein
MHDVYGTEIYVNYHREELTRETEHEREIIQAKRMVMNREDNRPSQSKV